MSPRTSVVVLDVGAPAGVSRTLDALRRLDEATFEVIVVDAGPAGGRLRSDGDLAGVKPLRCHGRTLARSCNDAIAEAAGDLVAFTFAGWCPAPTWLIRLGEVFDDDEVAVSGGAVLRPDGVNIDAVAWIVDSFGRHRSIQDIPRQDYWSSPYSDRFLCAVPGNSAFRRKRLIEIGGLDERYEGPLALADACRRLLDRGWIVRPVGRAPVLPPSPTSPIKTDAAVAVTDAVLFALTHGLPRHSFADVARAVGALSVGDRAAGDAGSASDRGFQLWRSPAAARPAEHLQRGHRPFLQFERLQPSTSRLHVCYVAQEWLPVHNGVARLVHARASGLAARGHLVRVLTTTEGPPMVALEDGIWIHRIPTIDHPPPPGVVMPPRLWNRSASVLDELVRISDEQPIDVVDVPNWDVEGYATIIDGRFVTVLGLHSGVAAYVATDPRFSMDDPIVREVLDAELTCYQQADAFLAASNAVVAEIEQGFGVSFPRERLGLVPHGLSDVDLSNQPPSPEGDGDDLDVLFVGRLEPRKGVDTLLAAIPMVLDAVPSVRFTLVGDDEIRSPDGGTFRLNFEQSADGKRLSDRVRFTGIVDDGELMRRYRSCDVFVAPSRFESFGLILLEAMRLGKPVVAGDAGGMREVIGDEGAGILVPPGDPAALAGALGGLLLDPRLRIEVGAAGRRRFEEHFTLQRMVDGIEAYFADLVERRRADEGHPAERQLSCAEN